MTFYGHPSLVHTVVAAGAVSYLAGVSCSCYGKMEEPHPFPLGTPVTAPAAMSPAPQGGVTVTLSAPGMFLLLPNPMGDEPIKAPTPRAFEVQQQYL